MAKINAELIDQHNPVPFLMYAEYEDDQFFYIYGSDESDCMCEICNMIELYGDVTFYTGVSNEDYEAGEYIGRDNFIYD